MPVVTITCAAPFAPLLLGRFDMLTLTHPLVAGLLQRRHGFDSWSVRVGCAVALLQFTPVSIIPLMLHIHSFVVSPTVYDLRNWQRN
jgi:hypothetical protein